MAGGKSPSDPESDPSAEGLDHDAQSRKLVPPTLIEYERWWKAYQAGARSPAKLAGIVKASIHRVRHAVRTGWPDQNFPAFKDRAGHSDSATAAATRKVVTESEVRVAEEVARVIAGSWEDAARQQLATAASTTDALAKLGQRLATAAAQASFESYRRVPDTDAHGKERRDAKGNIITKLVKHTSAFSMAAAAARLATAAKDHAALSRALLSTIAPGQPQGALVGPPAVILYLPDNESGPPDTPKGTGGNGGSP